MVGPSDPLGRVSVSPTTAERAKLNAVVRNHFQTCSCQRATDLPRPTPIRGRLSRASLRSLDVRKYVFGSQSCATDLVRVRSSALFRQLGRGCHLWWSSSHDGKSRSRSRSSVGRSRLLHPRSTARDCLAEYLCVVSRRSRGEESEPRPPDSLSSTLDFPSCSSEDSDSSAE